MIILERGTIAQEGIGKPDYQREIHRAKQLFGYTLDYSESLLWLCTICVPSPGLSVITRGPLAIGDTMYAINCADGEDHIDFAAGVDYIIKEFWISFDQDVEYRMYQGGTFDDISCVAFIKGGEKPVNLFQLGWTRSLLEDITVASLLQVSIINKGGAPAYGKVWVEGFHKVGRYLWV